MHAEVTGRGADSQTSHFLCRPQEAQKALLGLQRQAWARAGLGPQEQPGARVLRLLGRKRPGLCQLCNLGQVSDPLWASVPSVRWDTHQLLLRTTVWVTTPSPVPGTQQTTEAGQLPGNRRAREKESWEGVTGVSPASPGRPAAGTPRLTHSGEAGLEPSVDNFIPGQAWAWPLAEGRCWGQKPASWQVDSSCPSCSTLAPGSSPPLQQGRPAVGWSLWL